MTEQFAAHIRLHSYADKMSPILQNIVQHSFYNVQTKQRAGAAEQQI